MRPKEIIVLAICGVILLALILPALITAQRAAARMQSSNNLKQLGLGVANYTDTYRRLPAGVVRHNQEPVLGWLVPIQPYLEASSWYYSLNQTLPFDHPAAYTRYLNPMPTLLIPGVNFTFTKDGFALTHYMANPNVMSLRPHVKLDEFTAGMASTWLFGEASGHYQPMAYAYNWRPLAWPLCDGPDTFGQSHFNVAQFSMADGSVQVFARDTDRGVLERLASAPPLASKEEARRPERYFELTGNSAKRRSVHYSTTPRIRMKGGGEGTYIIYAVDGRTPEFAHVTEESEYVESTELDLAGVVERYPSLTAIAIQPLDDRAAGLIRRLHNLRTIITSGADLSDESILLMKSLSNLRMLSIVTVRPYEALTEPQIETRRRQEETIRRLREQLPHLQILVSER